MKKRFLTFAVAFVMLLGIMPGLTVTSSEQNNIAIINPYEGVAWADYGQYKTALHAHTTNSDGSGTLSEMVERYYELGFDVLAITDHNFVTNKWSKTANGLTAAREKEIFEGKGLNSEKRGSEPRPMYPVRYTNEQSRGDHLNTFFVDYNNILGQTDVETHISAVQDRNGISHLNHPGRHTGGMNGGTIGEAASNNPATVKKYVDLFMKYPSCIGMEIINKLDNESRSDRILWDNILKQTMPQGRNVWGFSEDDAHSVNAAGYSYNVLLMDKSEFLNNGILGFDEESAFEYTTQSANNPIRKALENGAFYTVSHVDRRENVRADMGRGSGNDTTLYLLSETTPSITDIIVDASEGSITVKGLDYTEIDWIADGVKILTEPRDASGNTLILAEHPEINSYVRFHIKSDLGIAYSQPFGIVSVPVVKAAERGTVVTIAGSLGDVYAHLGVTMVIVPNDAKLSSANVTNITYLDQCIAGAGGKYTFRVPWKSGLGDISDYSIYMNVEGRLVKPNIERITALTEIFDSSAVFNFTEDIKGSAEVTILNPYMALDYPCTVVMAAYREDGALVGMKVTDEFILSPDGLNTTFSYEGIPSETEYVKVFIFTDLGSMLPYLTNVEPVSK